MLVYLYSNSAIDKKGEKNMSEELRNAVETESWEYVSYDQDELTLDEEMRLTFEDYKWSNVY